MSFSKLFFFMSFCAVCCFSASVSVAQKYESEENTVFSANILPAQYGSVDTIVQKDESAPWVILIRDSHDNLNSQRNTAEILSCLWKNKLLDSILIEGATGPFDLNLFTQYPDKEAAGFVLNYLLNNLYINGVEYFSAKGGFSLPFFGIENADIYSDNLDSLNSSMRFADVINIFCSDVKEFIAISKQNILCDELLNFESWKKSYCAGDMAIYSYISKIKPQSTDLAAHFPNLYNFIKFEKKLKQIDFSELSQEETAVFNEMKNRLDKQNYQQLNKCRMAFYTGCASPFLFYGTLMANITEQDLNMELYSNIALYAGLLAHKKEIELNMLEKEINRVEQIFINSHALTIKEKSLYELESLFERTESFLLLGMTSRDVESFDGVSQHAVSEIIKLIDNIDSGYNLKAGVCEEKLTQVFKEVDQFYKLAKKRDGILANNALDLIENNNFRYPVIFAGGFHTDGILESLGNHNVNTVVITPQFSIGNANKPNSNVFTFSKITQKNEFQKYLSRVVNAISIPRWLSKVHVGVSESEVNAKLIETTTLIMAVHAENLLRRTPTMVTQDVLLVVNKALQSISSPQIANVRVANIRRNQNHREYELRINGEPLFFNFLHNNEDLTWDVIKDDMRHVLARQFDFSGIFSVVASKVPVRLRASRQTRSDQADADAFIEWAKDLSETTNANFDKVDVTSPAPAVLTVSRDADDVVISLIGLSVLPGERNIIFQDRIPAWRITPEHLMYQTKAIRKLYGTAYSISSYTMVVDIGKGSAERVTNKNPEVFKQAARSLYKTTSEDDSFGDFPFEDSDYDTHNYSETQFMDKMVRNIRRMKSFALVFQIAKKSNNKNLLNLISSEKFHSKLDELYLESKKELKKGYYPLIIIHLLSNQNTPPSALLNIINKPDFFELISSPMVFPASGLNGLYQIMNHDSLVPEILDKLADRLIELETQQSGSIRLAGYFNLFLPAYRLFNNKLVSKVSREIGLPKSFRNYLLASHARRAKFDIIAHAATSPDTIRKLHDPANRAANKAIARSHHPEIVADVKMTGIRDLIIANPNTSLSTLIEFMNQDDSEKIRNEIANYLSQRPKLSDEEIDHLMQAHDFNILINLLNSLFSQELDKENYQSLTRNILRVMQALNELVPDVENEKDYLDKLSRMTATLLTAPKLGAEMATKVNDELIMLASRYPELAYYIMTSDRHVNPMIIDMIVLQYSSRNEFIPEILIEAAKRDELSVGTMDRLADLKNLEITFALLINNRVAPILEDSEIAQFHSQYMPLKVTEQELLYLIEKNPNDMHFHVALAGKPWLPPNVLIRLVNFGHLSVEVKLASYQPIRAGLATILASKENKLIDSILLMNPSTPPDVVHRISRDVLDKFKDKPIFHGMSERDIESYIVDYPFLKKNSSVLDYLIQNTHILSNSNLIKVLVSSSCAGSLSQKLALELINKSRQGYTKDTYTRLSPFLFTGVKVSEYYEEFTPEKIDVKLADAQLNRYHADLVPVGALFQLANSLYVYIQDIKDTHKNRAEELTRLLRDMYEYSVLHKNNPHALLALNYLDNNQPIPESLLYIHPNAQVLALDLHNAQPFDEKSIYELDAFHHHNWESFSYEQRLVYDLVTHMLRDTVRRGILNSTSALGLLNQFMNEPFSRGAWQTRRRKLLHDMVVASDLPVYMKDDLLSQPVDSIEFFLRQGPRAVLYYGRYQSFVDNLIIDNVPSALHDDVARTVWFELMNVTESQMFIEPHYLSHIRLIKYNGEAMDRSGSIQVSFPVVRNLSVQPVDATALAEIGHTIDFALFRDDTDQYYPAFGEFQDRSTMLYFPKELDDNFTAKPIINEYKMHDDAVVELFLEYQKMADKDGEGVIKRLMDLLIYFTPQDMTEQFLVKNARALYFSKQRFILHASEQRLIGELLYCIFKSNPKIQHPESLVEKVSEIKERIEKLPWNVRAFFDGGSYLSTYGSAYSQILPPSRAILGTDAAAELSLLEAHVAAEWLSYFFRVRIRELLQKGELTSEALPQFYRTAVYYLHNKVYKDGVKPDQHTVLNEFRDLSPAELFAEIEDRKINGSVLTRSKSIAPQKVNIAKPEKLMLKAFTKLIEDMFFEGFVSFGQMVQAGSFFMNKVYPLLAEDEKINATEDLSRTQYPLNVFSKSLFSALNYVFDSSEDTWRVLREFVTRPHNDGLKNSAETEKNPHSERLVDITVKNFEQTTDSSLLGSTRVVIDFDDFIHHPSESMTLSKLFAFRTMFYQAMKNIPADDMKGMASNVIFYSKIYSQEDMAVNLLKAGFSSDLFNFIGVDSPKISSIGLKNYLLNNYGVSINNTILVSGDRQSQLQDVFLAENGIVIKADKTDGLIETSAYVKMLMDFLVYNSIANGTTVAHFNDSALKRLNVTDESHIITAHELFRGLNKEPEISIQKDKNDQSSSSRTVLPLDALSGVTLVLPASTFSPHARKAELETLNSLIDQSL